MSELYAKFKLRRKRFELNAELFAPGKGVTALFGPSGSGKTMLLRCIAGLEKPTSGRLIVNGEIWDDTSVGVWLKPHERDVGFVFQDSGLFTHLTAKKNLEFGYRRARDSSVESDQVIDWLSLEPLLDQYPDELSGGEKQRVAIGRALLSGPKLLLMDEPLASMDETSKSEIFPYLERLHNDLSIPVIFVTHSFAEVARIADYMALMRDGAIYSAGSVAQVATDLDSSLAFEKRGGAVITARVAEHDERYQLTYLDFPGGRLSVAKSDHELGSEVRAQVIPSDVSLTIAKPERSSILNIFDAQVEQIAKAGPSQVIVKLNVGGTFILSRITRKSKETLGITEGSKVYAQIKSAALVT